MPSKACWTTSALIALLSAPCAAQPTTTTPDFARTFGIVVGSEDVCDLTFRKGSIEAAIAMNVAPADLDFAHMFGVYARTAAGDFELLTPAARVAHCAAIAANARALGLLD